jgi:7-cyano-7-deazaguanine synthase in queuosine biosynthesis
MNIIEIPKITPLGKSVYTVGIWLSGGADSALLCYMLAEYILQQNLDIKIQPITIDYKRPFAKKAVFVQQKISEILNANNIFCEHVVYHPPENTTWTPDELSEQFHIRNYEHFKNGLFQVLFSGITTNPSLEVQQTFNWGVLQDVELKRGSAIPKETNRYFVHPEGGEFWELKPFFNLNKQKLAELYKDKNLLDNLFPITRSCEHTGTVHGHCGNCWWCEERRWAFGRLE